MIRRCVGLFICFLVASPLCAQTDRASVNGTVTDSSGAVVGDAKIEAVSLETGFRRQASSGEAGTYQLPGLPIGTYKISVEKEGFKSVILDRVILSVGEARTIDAQLGVGAIAEEVQVTTSAEALNRTSAEVSAVIDSSQI